MYKEKGLSGRPTHVSARRAAIAFALGAATGIGIGIAGMNDPTLPFLGLYGISVITIIAGIASGLLAIKYWLLNRQIHLEFKWLAKSRFYTFLNGRTPYLNQRGELVCPWPWKEPVHVSVLLESAWAHLARPLRWAWRIVAPWAGSSAPSEPRHTRRWTVEWVPYATTRTVSKDAQGNEIVTFGKAFKPGRITDAFIARADWLKAGHPDRYERVLGWWQAEHKQTTREPAPQTSFWVEYLEGANVACEPSWWSKKLGHGCDFDPIGRLQGVLRELPESQQVNVTLPPPLPTDAEASEFFYGKGGLWEQRHCQKYAWHRGYNQSEAGKSPDQGDARMYALVIKDEIMAFRPVSDVNQHMVVWGATGVGKTRLLEQFTDQIIRSGFPLLIIDPKGDEEWMNRALTAARESGRAHQFRYFNLVLPNNRNVATMNPMSHCNEFTHLGNRLGSVIVSASDEYFRAKAIQVVRDVYMAVGSCREFLRLLGRDRTTGNLLPEDSTEVPLVLLAIQYAGSHPGCSPAAAEKAVRQILLNMRNPAWKSEPDEYAVVKLATMREYTPQFWCPTIRHASFYALEKTTLFLGLLAKVAQFHAYMDVSAPTGQSSRPQHAGKTGPISPSAIPPFAAPDFALTAPSDAITGIPSKGGKPPPMSLMQIYREAGNHPMELRLGSVLPLNAGQEKWKAYYDYFVPMIPGDDPSNEAMAITASYSRLNDQISTITSFAELDRSDFLQQISTLQSALARFKGPIERIVCAMKPDITWKEMIEDNHIVYCSLGASVEQDGAAGYAKMIMSDLLSYTGEIYHFQQRQKAKAKPWFVLADELARWVNNDVVELLATGRGAGAHLILAGQTRADLAAGLGNENRAKQFLSNINTVFQMRAAHEDDANAFSTHVGKTSIIKTSLSNRLTSDMLGAGNKMIDLFSGDTTYSLHLEEVDLISPEISKKLPQGQVMVSTMGGETYYLAVGMFPPTAVSIKEQYGTLTDGRDQDAAKNIGIQIRHQLAIIKQQHDEIARRAALGLGTAPSATQPPSPLASAAPSDPGNRQADDAHAPTSPPVAPEPPTSHAPTVPPQKQPPPPPVIPPAPAPRILPPIPSPHGSVPKPPPPPGTHNPEIKPPGPAGSTDPSRPSAPDSTVALPNAPQGSIHLPQIPTARPDRTDSIGGGSPFELDD